MMIDILRVPGASRRLAPVEPRLAPLFCLVLLTAGCAVASCVLACATPFPAYGVVAAAMLPLSSALAVAGAAWVVNQAIGFGLLGYPHDVSTLGWGVALGLAALAAVVAAKAALRVRASTPVALGAAGICAYAAYELVLFAFTPVLGDESAFSAAIVGRLGVLNLLWLIGLVAVCAAVRFFAAARARPALS